MNCPECFRKFKYPKCLNNHLVRYQSNKRLYQTGWMKKRPLIEWLE